MAKKTSSDLIVSQQEPQIDRVLEGKLRFPTKLAQTAQYKLTKAESKILSYALAKSEKEGHYFEAVQIPVSVFISAIATKSHNAHRTIKNTVGSLPSTYVIISSKDKKGKPIHDQLPWFQRIRYEYADSGEAVINIIFNPALKPYFDDPQHTRSEVLFNFNYSCSYSPRIYSLLRGYDYRLDTNEPIDFTIEQLMTRLDVVNEPGYQRYYNLKTRLLLPAMEDINSITDIKVTMVEHKGRHNKTTKVSFYIESQQSEIERLIEESRKGNPLTKSEYDRQSMIIHEALLDVVADKSSKSGEQDEEQLKFE